MWEDVEGQEGFPVSAGFELTTLGLLIQEDNYSATATHTPAHNKMLLQLMEVLSCFRCRGVSLHTSVSLVEGLVLTGMFISLLYMRVDDRDNSHLQHVL